MTVHDSGQEAPVSSFCSKLVHYKTPLGSTCRNNAFLQEEVRFQHRILCEIQSPPSAENDGSRADSGWKADFPGP